MKIAFVSTRSDTIGGSNIHIRDLALRLRDDGHDVHVLGGQTGLFSDDLERYDIPYTPLKYLVRDIRPFVDIRAAAELRRHLRALKPDLLSLHTAKAGAVGRFAAVGLKIPVLYTPHGWTFADGVPGKQVVIYETVERMLAPLSARIITVCENDRELAAGKRVGTKRLVTIHNGMPDTDVPLAEPATSPVRLLMVARFEEQKDHRTLIEALATLSDLDWTLDLAGGGPLQDEITALVAEHGLQDKVSFLGHRNDIAELMSRSQAFVLITHWEGFPRSILEAMRAGLPVVATDVAGVPEAVEESITGLLTERADVTQVSQKLRLLIEEPELRERLGRMGRQRYVERFTFESMYQKTTKIYREVLGGADGDDKG